MRRFKQIGIPVLLIVGLMFGSIGAMAQEDDKPTISVGSKNFAEQIILGNMYALLLEDAGYPVERNLNLGGTAVAHQALVNDEIDMYVEYTGTGLVAILGEEVPTPAPGSEATPPAAGATPVAPVAQQTYDLVAGQYPEEFGAVWLQPLGFNDTFAMIVTRETADSLGLETISDLQGNANDMTLGSEPEFPIREDGLPGLRETYNIAFANVITMDSGLLYSAVDNGEVDIVSGISTDGRVPALDLVILNDDRNYFPPYYAAPVVRQEVLKANPELKDVLNQLAGKIDNETMQQLNYQVDGQGGDPEDVARQFLQDRGLIDSGD